MKDFEKILNEMFNIDEFDQMLEALEQRIDALTENLEHDDPKEDPYPMTESYYKVQIDIMHRIAKHTYEDLKPEYKKSLADVPIRTLCDVFGWDDIFPKEEEE